MVDPVVDELRLLRKQLLDKLPGDGIHQLALEGTQRNILAGIYKMANIKSGQAAKEEKARLEAIENLETDFDRESEVRNRGTEGIKKSTNPLVGTFQKFRNFLGEHSKALHTHSRKTLSGTSALGTATEVLTGSTSAIGGIVQQFLGYGEIGTILTKLGRELGQSIDTYRQLNNVGQNFNGSLLQMELGAAQARLPLDTFAKAIMKNSTAIAELGGPQQFANLYRQVRANIDGMAQYGLTLDQSSQYFSDYLAAEQMSGRSLTDHSDQLVGGFTDLLDETDKLSKETGVARDKLIDFVNTFKQSPDTFAFLGAFGDASGNVEKSLNHLLTQFGTLGESGQEMAQAIVQNATLGTTMYSQVGQDLNAFAGPLRAGLDNLQHIAVQGGDTTDAFRNLGKQALALSEDQGYMQDLATKRAAGIEGAAATEKVIQALAKQERTIEENAAKPRDYQNATKAVLDFQNAMENALGTIKEGFLEGLGPFADALNAFLGEDGKTLLGYLHDFGVSLGRFVGEVFTPANIQALVAGFSLFLSDLKDVALAVVTVTDWLVNGFKSAKDFFSRAGFGEQISTIITLVLGRIALMIPALLVKGLVSTVVTGIGGLFGAPLVIGAAAAAASAGLTALFDKIWDDILPHWLTGGKTAAQINQQSQLATKEFVKQHPVLGFLTHPFTSAATPDDEDQLNKMLHSDLTAAPTDTSGAAIPGAVPNYRNPDGSVVVPIVPVNPANIQNGGATSSANSDQTDTSTPTSAGPDDDSGMDSDAILAHLQQINTHLGKIYQQGTGQSSSLKEIASNGY